MTPFIRKQLIKAGKTRAALTHLLPSLIVLAIIAGLILFAWYPYPFLQFKDGFKFALLLIICATLIGPALTWFVHKTDKKKLVFDLIVITLMQLTAISFGTFAIYQDRPYFMVFTIDRFEVLSVRDVNISAVTNPQFLDRPFASPILLFATMPTDEESYQALLQEVMLEGKPDLQFRPEYWSLYTDKQKQVLDVSKPLVQLRLTRPEAVEEIDKLVKANGGDINSLKFVPALLSNRGFTVILDADSGDVLDASMIDPWVD